MYKRTYKFTFPRVGFLAKNLLKFEQLNGRLTLRPLFYRITLLNIHKNQLRSSYSTLCEKTLLIFYVYYKSRECHAHAWNIFAPAIGNADCPRFLAMKAYSSVRQFNGEFLHKKLRKLTINVEKNF
jgi:hypothetical protein